jgi:hypothetical protein
MKRIILAMSLMAGIAKATTNYVVYSADNGTIVSWDQHFEIKKSQLSDDGTWFKSMPEISMRKKVLITSENPPQNISQLTSKILVDASDLIGNTVAASDFVARSNVRNAYENAYFQLVKAVLTLANDPRKDVTTIPKLSFEELDVILDTLYEVPATEKRANKLALKLMSVNAALQRYDLQWWDSATQH